MALVEADDAPDRCCWVEGGVRCTEVPIKGSPRMSVCAIHDANVRALQQVPGEEQDAKPKKQPKRSKKK